MSASAPPTVSIVIPALNAASRLIRLARLFANQKPTPAREVIVVDSGSVDGTAAEAERLGFRVVPVFPFSHGGARNLGAREARGDVVVFLTQDAEPADEGWLRELTAPFEETRVVAVYGRQIPRSDASPLERLFLARRFPEGERQVRRYAPGSPIGYEEAFFSNVNAAVRRSVLLEHPFDDGLLMCEDQQFSQDVLRKGWAVAYAPRAAVIHSHVYSAGQYFRRYFDSVVALRQVFGRRFGWGTSARLGRSYVGGEWRTILRDHPGFFPRYIGLTGIRITAALCAYLEPVLPWRWCRWMSLHPAYWGPAPKGGGVNRKGTGASPLDADARD